jgi:hypothetical protein
MIARIEMALALRPIGRVLLHLAALSRNGRFRFHLAGIARELKRRTA